MAKSMPVIKLVRIVILIFLLIGSIMYWAAMGANTYGSFAISDTRTQTFGLYKFCTITKISDTQFQTVCSKYNKDPPYITTSKALFGVFVTLDVLMILALIGHLFTKPRRRKRDNRYFWLKFKTIG